MRHVGLLGAVGETMALLGLGLLWTYREQAADWLRELLEIWRGEVSGPRPASLRSGLPEGRNRGGRAARLRSSAPWHWFLSGKFSSSSTSRFRIKLA